MKEATGNTEAVRSLRYFGMWAHKLPDVIGMGRFTDTKPFDIVACSKKGRFIAIEGKMIKKWEAFSIKKLREHQVINLDAIASKRGGRAFVFLYIRIPANKKTGEKRVTTMVYFDWKLFKRSLTTGYTAKQLRDERPGEWVETFTHEGKLHYDLKSLLK